MILGLDTSSARLSLALWENGRMLEEHACFSDRRHNEIILPALESLLLKINRAACDLSGIVVGLGPGSFTGVRVGISTAQGLGQSLGIPVAGVSSFLAVAAGSRSNNALVIADARQNMLYAAFYRKKEYGWETVMPETLISIPDMVKQLPATAVNVTGPGAQEFFETLFRARGGELHLLPPERHWPEAGALAPLGEKKILAGGMSWEDITPLYLRRTQAEEVRARRKAEQGGI